MSGASFSGGLFQPSVRPPFYFCFGGRAEKRQAKEFYSKELLAFIGWRGAEKTGRIIEIRFLSLERFKISVFVENRK